VLLNPKKSRLRFSVTCAILFLFVASFLEIWTPKQNLDPLKISQSVSLWTALACQIRELPRGKQTLADLAVNNLGNMLIAATVLILGAVWGCLTFRSEWKRGHTGDN
jgi:hypothetical protein